MATTEPTVSPIEILEPLGGCGGRCEFLDRMHFLEVDHIEVHNAFIEVLNSGDWCWALQELGFAERRHHEGEMLRQVDRDHTPRPELLTYQLERLVAQHNFEDPVAVARFVWSLDVFLTDRELPNRDQEVLWPGSCGRSTCSWARPSTT